MSEAENHCGAGRRGEDEALSHLLAKGYRLLERNYRFGRGEIDLIVEDPRRVLVFVEVKSNRGIVSGHPLQRIDGRKIRQLQRLAQRYVARTRQEQREMRFDVVGVQLDGTGAAGTEHIENAFLPDGGGYFTSR
jgi:putative endonuclease